MSGDEASRGGPSPAAALSSGPSWGQGAVPYASSVGVAASRARV